jgi:hypothetical protein
MSDDLDEFMDLAEKEHSSSPRAPLGDLTTSALAQKDRSDDEDKVEQGTATQYAKFGPGYIPTTPTVATLPAGIYKVFITQSGAFLNPQSVITDSLIRLPDSRSDEVITEIERFWTLKARFKQFGFVHKRGFLLWGPPGSGKTSTVAFVMKQMVQKGGIVIIGDCAPHVLAPMLAKIRQVEPDRQIVVVLEDLDTLIHMYGESAVLSLLDGEDSIANVVYLATTNYPEELDGRVVNRPSRFDRVVKIGMPNKEARGVYLRSCLTTESEDVIQKWVAATEGFSVAHIKELIVGVHCFGNDLDAEADRLRKMGKTPKSSDFEGKMGFGG